MLLKDDKKGLVTVIMKKMSDGKEKTIEPSSIEKDNSIAMEHCAQKALSAIESKNAKALKSALIEFFNLCEEEEDKGEYEDEKEEQKPSFPKPY